MKDKLILLLLAGLLALAACSAGAAEPAASGAASALGDSDLSPAAQLALGTLQLEDSDNAVDETQAATLLPLWQAYQSLSSDETTAAAELDALAGQIERAMTAAQQQAIADMKLTTDSLTELQESGALAFGGPGTTDQSGTGDGSGGFQRPSGDFQPPAGGDFSGAPPGGAPPGGGFVGSGDFGGGADLSEDDLATRQAAMANMDPAEMQARMLTGMVIRLLQQKTGEVPAGGPGGLGGGMDAALSAVAEATGLSIDDLRAQTAEGQTLAQIIEANGGDVAAVRAAIVTALQALPNAADMDVEQMADRLLEGGGGPPPLPSATATPTE